MSEFSRGGGDTRLEGVGDGRERSLLANAPPVPASSGMTRGGMRAMQGFSSETPTEDNAAKEREERELNEGLEFARSILRGATDETTGPQTIKALASTKPEMLEKLLAKIKGLKGDFPKDSVVALTEAIRTEAAILSQEAKEKPAAS